jgi:hypothetical protein
MDAARPAPPGARTATSGEGVGLRAWGAAFVYLGIAVIFTWPVARSLTKDVPSDLGDSLLNMWILSWDAEQLRHVFAGDLSVLARWFDGNIFYPLPNTLAYSEHLFAQAIQIFPIYLVTKNPILCYNLLFLSTYVLSGLGAYLLVSELTGDRRAAFVAGLIFAFVPYRIPQASHLQVLSSQWMPFTLYGFARYLNTGRRRALAGGALALLLQGLSCGYYLVYFSPFAAGYVVWELARRGRLGDRRAWVDLTLAALGVGIALTPFLMAYARMQSSMQLNRGIGEVSLYSADVYAYLTSFPTERFWGPILHVAPRAEGELFMGAVPLLLGLTAAGLLLVQSRRAGRATGEPRPVLSGVLGGISAALLGLVIVTLFTRRVSIDIGGLSLRVFDIGRALAWLAVAVMLWLLSSPRARVRLRACGTAEAFFLLSIVVAWWLSLGPTPLSLGRPLDVPAPYRLFYLLPGVDGVRTPARFAMVVALMLAVTGGYVLARLPRGRVGTFVASALAAVFLIEAPASEFPVNGRGVTRGHALPEARVYPPADAPSLYHTVAGLVGPIVLLEIPLGDLNWDVRAVYYAATHWRPLINGYSGFFPPHYGTLSSALTDPDRHPAEAWQAVVGSGATHVMVHERAYREAEANQIHRWLVSSGAREVARDDGDVLYDVRR